MMLVVTASLRKLIIKFCERAGEEIRAITCCRICFGGTYPLNVLKFTVDFEDDLFKYEEQMLLYTYFIPSIHRHWY